EEEKQAVQRLLSLANNPTINADQRLKAIGILLGALNENYSVKLQALGLVLTLLEGESISKFLEENWGITESKKADPSDIELIFEFARSDMVPIKVRNEMFLLLQQMVPQFTSIKEEIG
ncbi:MAG TPA: hypothetical protein VEL72_00060, partial [Ktedonobacteraceae bacterium]|nr:hypothetical protein [Ktedonobacteraceae bacterium]